MPSPPEPDLTPKDLVARAVALRPKLVEQQAECEERTYYSEEMHQEFVDAGFYRLYVPRRYGGYEFDVPTFMRVVLELARGCPSTAWCMGLAAGHALQVGSWWEERAQAEIFGDGDFRAAAVAAPISPATRSDHGWELNGQAGYASGIPYSTHDDDDEDDPAAAVRTAQARPRLPTVFRTGDGENRHGRGCVDERRRPAHGAVPGLFARSLATSSAFRVTTTMPTCRARAAEQRAFLDTEVGLHGALSNPRLLLELPRPGELARDGHATVARWARRRSTIGCPAASSTSSER